MDPYPTYLKTIHPLLFRLTADDAHRVAQFALRWERIWRQLGPGPAVDQRLEVTIGPIRLANPVGLAPGFDKNCDLLKAVQHLGFGFVAPGAIMREPRAGNPEPRLARIVDQRALVNCMGLPSKGIEHAITRLQEFVPRRVPVFANVQGTSPRQIVENVVAIQPHAEALEISLNCPNTTDTDSNKDFGAIASLLAEISNVRTRPVFPKIPEQFRGEQLKRLPDFLTACIDAGLEGVVASATRRHDTKQLSRGQGQLSGSPIFLDTLALVRRIADYSQGRLSILASGGVMTGRDAYAMLAAGATALQIYSAFIYRGWMAPALINRELVAALDALGLPSLRAIRTDAGRDSVRGERSSALPDAAPSCARVEDSPTRSPKSYSGSM